MSDRSTLTTQRAHLACFLRAGAGATVDQDAPRRVPLIAAAVQLRSASEAIVEICGPTIPSECPWIGDLTCRRDRGFLRST